MRVLILQYSSKCLILLNMLMLSYQKKSKFYHFWKAEKRERFGSTGFWPPYIYHMLVYLLLKGNPSENKCFANFRQTHLQRYRRPCWVSWPYPIRAKFRLFLRVKQFEKKLCRHRRPIKRQEADKQPIMVHFTYRHSGQTGQSKDRRQTNNQSWCTLHTDTADRPANQKEGYGQTTKRDALYIQYSYSRQTANQKKGNRQTTNHSALYIQYSYSRQTANQKEGYGQTTNHSALYIQYSYSRQTANQKKGSRQTTNHDALHLQPQRTHGQ